MKEEEKKSFALRAELTALAALLFCTGIYLIHLKQENREIRQRLDREIQQGIAGEVFRFHVIANSDRQEDQEIKLEVKSEITEYLKELLPGDSDLEKTKEAVLTHLPEIEERAGYEKKGFCLSGSGCGGKDLVSGKDVWGLYLSGRRV